MGWSISIQTHFDMSSIISEITCRWDENEKTCIVPCTGSAPTGPSQLIMTRTATSSKARRFPATTGTRRHLDSSLRHNVRLRGLVTGTPKDTGMNVPFLILVPCVSRSLSYSLISCYV